VEFGIERVFAGLVFKSGHQAFVIGDYEFGEIVVGSELDDVVSLTGQKS
jgi:hypothetical protein